jgi:hypothetical protein
VCHPICDDCRLTTAAASASARVVIHAKANADAAVLTGAITLPHA